MCSVTSIGNMNRGIKSMVFGDKRASVLTVSVKDHASIANPKRVTYNNFNQEGVIPLVSYKTLCERVTEARKGPYKKTTSPDSPSHEMTESDGNNFNNRFSDNNEDDLDDLGNEVKKSMI